jgi:hypothetical protein
VTRERVRTTAYHHLPIHSFAYFPSGLSELYRSYQDASLALSTGPTGSKHEKKKLTEVVQSGNLDFLREELVFLRGPVSSVSEPAALRLGIVEARKNDALANCNLHVSRPAPFLNLCHSENSESHDHGFPFATIILIGLCGKSYFISIPSCHHEQGFQGLYTIYKSCLIYMIQGCLQL